MIAKHASEIAVLREGGKRLGEILRSVARAVRPGIRTDELDALARVMISTCGGESVFLGYRAEPKSPPYPAVICVSVNSEVVHGIPRKDLVLREGDIVGIDIGMRYPAKSGLVTDCAVTVPVGNISSEARSLISATKRALEHGIAVVKPGIAMGDLGYAIQKEIESAGFSVVRDLVGHGVGQKLHEDPYVPNYGDPGRGSKIRSGLVIAIEPMATIGSPELELADDGWTWRTRDGSIAAHFEHTVLVKPDGAEILTI